MAMKRAATSAVRAFTSSGNSAASSVFTRHLHASPGSKKIVGVFYKANEYASANPDFVGCAENALGIREWLESKGHQYIVTPDKDGPDCELDKHIPDLHVLISTPFHPAYVTAERIKKAKNLQLLLTAGIGSDHIDLKAAADAGLTVAEVTGSNVVSVAEDELMRILILVRNFLPGYHQVINGEWDVAAIAHRAYDLEGDSLPISTKEVEEDLRSSSSAALLSQHSSPHSPKKTTVTTIVFISLAVTTAVSLSFAAAFAFLFFSGSPPASGVHLASTAELSRPLSKLKHPVVIIISSDGFRFGYQYKTDLPNINRLIQNGTEAERGLIPVFPTLTFPNHYSIVTGLYPAYHGIINNYFTDPATGEKFNMGSHEPKWWLGEPLWETVSNQGLKASTFFWPGSQVNKGSWDCPKSYCMPYNESVPFEERVDNVLNYFDLPSDDIPSFMTLYFEDPDHQGHKYGPDDVRITEAIVEIDTLIGRLIHGLEKRGIFEDVNIILLGDHGMVGTCDKKVIALDDLANWVKIPQEWVQSYSPLLSIRPPPGYSSSDVVAKMNEGLGSGKVDNGEYLRVYLKEELPNRLHYSASDRISPVVGLVGEGFTVKQKRSKGQECGGAHGYDNAFFSMRSIFIGHGPQFGRGRKVPSFENVEIYNLVAAILNIKGASNNGSVSFAETVLLPKYQN